MRHHKQGKKFHRKVGDRRAFLRNLVTDMIVKGKIQTTETRAKAIRPMVERAVSISRRGDLSSRRLLVSRLHNRNAVSKLMDELGPRYRERRGGYTRIVKSGVVRKRDGVRTAIIEFV